MIVLDACVLIAFLNSGDAHHARARQLMAETAGHRRGASPMTIAEILVGPTRAGHLDVARDALAQLKVGQVLLGPDAPQRLARLRVDTGLKLPDCCVLLAAQDATAEAIATLDDRLTKAAGLLGFALVPDR